MNKLLGAARTRAGIVVSTVGLVMVGGGVAAAAVIGSPGPEATEPSETTASVEPTPETSAPVESAPVLVEEPVQDSSTATVEDVPSPQPAPSPAGPSLPPGHRMPDLPPGTPTDGVGTIDADGNYHPAPPIPRAGEPPVAPYTPPPSAPKLPGEEGYIPPAG